MLTFLLAVFAIFGNLILSEWSTEETDNKGKLPVARKDYFLGVYAGFGLLQGRDSGAMLWNSIFFTQSTKNLLYVLAIAIFLGSLFMYLGTLKSAAAYHSKMLRRVLHAPMSFFDTTPMGRIVNRFSKDIDTLDNFLPLNIKWWTVAAFKTMATIFVISYSTPLIIVGLIPILLLFLVVQLRNLVDL